jgi:hypothetical protein
MARDDQELLNGYPPSTADLKPCETLIEPLGLPKPSRSHRSPNPSASVSPFPGAVLAVLRVRLYSLISSTPQASERLYIGPAIPLKVSNPHEKLTQETVMRIHARPQVPPQALVTVLLTQCHISKVVSAKGKVQVVLETELSEVAHLEDVKALVGLSAGLVDVSFKERPEEEAGE